MLCLVELIAVLSVVKSSAAILNVVAPYFDAMPFRLRLEKNKVDIHKTSYEKLAKKRESLR